MSMEYYFNKLRFQIERVKIEISHRRFKIRAPGIIERKKPREILISLRTENQETSFLEGDSNNDQVYNLDSSYRNGNRFIPGLLSTASTLNYLKDSLGQALGSLRSRFEYSDQEEGQETQVENEVFEKHTRQSMNNSVNTTKTISDVKSERPNSERSEKSNGTKFSDKYFPRFKRKKFHLVTVLPSPIVESKSAFTETENKQDSADWDRFSSFFNPKPTQEVPEIISFEMSSHDYNMSLQAAKASIGVFPVRPSKKSRESKDTRLIDNSRLQEKYGGHFVQKPTSNYVIQGKKFSNASHEKMLTQKSLNIDTLVSKKSLNAKSSNTLNAVNNSTLNKRSNAGTLNKSVLKSVFSPNESYADLFSNYASSNEDSGVPIIQDENILQTDWEN